jgi:hypothetical protein
MKAQKLTAATIKKALKVYGVDVKRCQQNKLGVLVTIAKSDINLNKCLVFFNEFSIKRSPSMNVSPVSIGSDYIDFGTVFHYVD